MSRDVVLAGRAAYARMLLVSLLALGLCSATPSQAAESMTPLEDLATAEQAAIDADPRFASLELARKRHEALIRQAGLGPNPELEVEIEEFGGTGDLEGIDALATSVRYSQALEPSGRRQARIAVVQAEAALFETEAEAIRWEIRGSVQQAYVAVLSAHAALKLREAELLLAQESQGVADVRVEAGSVAPLEAMRVRIDLIGAESAVIAAEQELANAIAQFNRLTGLPAITSDQFAGALVLPDSLPDKASLEGGLTEHPLVQRWALEAAVREAKLKVAKAENLKDLSWSAGLSHFNETDDVALMAGVSWEWPSKNRNQGEIAAAQIDIDRIESEQLADERTLRADFESAYQELSLAYGAAKRLETNVIPGIDEVLALTQEAYRAGKVGIIDVLDVQRLLIEANGQHREAVTRYYSAAASLRGLTGWNIFDSTTAGAHS